MKELLFMGTLKLSEFINPLSSEMVFHFSKSRELFSAFLSAAALISLPSSENVSLRTDFKLFPAAQRRFYKFDIISKTRLNSLKLF